MILEQHEARVALIKRRVLRWGSIAVGAVVVVILIAWIGGKMGSSDEEATTATTVTATTEAGPTTTTIAPTYETPETPQVSIPDELPTELGVTYLVDGDGPEAAAGDTVVVHYIGVRSADGTVFDGSYDRGTPFSVQLGLGTVIQGWDQGLVGAQKGDRIQLDIPAELAYGDQAVGSVIQPGDALTFVVDVMDVIPGAQS